LKNTKNIIIVGHPHSTKEVADTLNKKHFATTEVRYIKGLKNKMSLGVDAIVFALPLKRGNVMSIKRNLNKLSKFKNIPFFLVSPKWLPEKSMLKIYKLGFRMIFRWPEHKIELSNSIMTCLETGSMPVRSQSRDESLRYAVMNKIKIMYGRKSKLFKVNVNENSVFLSGLVKNMEEKQQLSNLVKSMPGVKAVHTADIKVKTLLDSSKMKYKIPNIGGTLPKTVINHIDELGSIVMRGTVKNQWLKNKYERRMKELNPRIKVINQIIVSKKLYNNEANVLKNINSKIRKIKLSSPGRVYATLADGFVRLRGYTRKNIDSYHIIKSVKKMPHVKYVENYIKVAN